MQYTLYYFTSTGNSLQIARQLALNLKNTTITSMVTQPPNQPIGGQNHAIGFIFPVYFIGLPRIVKRFIQNLQIQPETYCFAITNFGGSQLDTLGMLDDILKQRSSHLSYGKGIKMPENYIPRYDAPPIDKAQKLIDTAIIEVNTAAETITKQEVHPIKRKVKHLCKIINYLFMYKNIETFDKKFTTTNTCNGCNICSNICPVNNITLNDNQHPVWHHKCERCMACIQWCPTKAIQYGKKTAAFKRYHNPTINIQDIVHSQSNELHL
ncbi:MAG: EFR1 family ferrodoxin [Nitrososphaerota archaeon]|jgi:ferredoxin|uniref:EFR1 family ferrodoxin n=1 Tax=Candidatus Bathycorpusculum sp. TaxID=2994959 RepID=UPI00282911CA|nr:EFR1 family ferrodoxin [Candidatus Termitimicrobium sp.]MCL2432241.1 EFR1 family ferrodoxin [Candidatus Termitimicrobium sp.]MDR0492240.1 EFR1 family ferrodoxin [Nitrososphaerota archaeon]